MKKVLFLVGVVILALSLLAPLSASAASLAIPPIGRVVYDAVPLTNFWARAINNCGQVAGRTPDGHAAIWSIRGGLRMINLGLNCDWSEAIGINDRGTVLVATTWNKDYQSGFCLVHRNGRVQQVDVPLHSTLHGLNNKNQIIGEFYSNYTQRGFIWDNGQITFITDPSQGFCTMAAINNAGQVLGMFWGNGPEQPFLWDNGIVYLETPDGEGRPEALNDRGEAAGAYSVYDANGSNLRYPVVWTPDGQMHKLESFGFPGQAMDINDRGEVVGNILPPTAPGVTVIWRNGQPPIPIEQILRQPVQIFGTGIHINNVGQIICNGFLAGQYGYYLLQPRCLRR